MRLSQRIQPWTNVGIVMQRNAGAQHVLARQLTIGEVRAVAGVGAYPKRVLVHHDGMRLGTTAHSYQFRRSVVDCEV